MDGGGGGSLNGRTVAIFSDTSTYNGSTSDKYAKIVSGGFVSNSAYYISDTSNPLAIEGFRNESNHGLPALAVPWFEDECPTSYDCDWWIWPNSTSDTNTLQIVSH